ncbi:putative short-chain dehydrogenase/reductase [Actinomycetes bacterium]|nr:putative short-chain dehydrogenase/reductase [Actinomycetes bacterium]
MNSQSTAHIPRGWRIEDLYDQTGKRFLITGGTSGLGRETARELARCGAQVTITARSAKKAEQTLNEIANNKVDYIEMDLTDLESVRKAARSLTGNYDVLILNAGIMAIPFAKTVDGFETQMSTNHLGHFAFAGLIKNKISHRIITVSSFAHRMGSFGSGSLDEIRDIALGKNKYSPWGAYGTSKLANLLFSFELERKARANNWPFVVVAAHPGYSNTNLQMVSSRIREKSAEERITTIINKIFGQSATNGALPTLLAATHPGLFGGLFVAPSGLMEMRGSPKLTRAREIAYDQMLATNLWSISEELTGVNWK